MERILPNSFIELLAGLLLLAALLVALVSLVKKDKKQVTKMAAILFVTSLCLFSENGWIYFVGVLIIVTTIVELDFFQNIASGIDRLRGDKGAIEKNKEAQEKVDSSPTEHIT